MFLLILDYLTKLSKLGPRSKQGNLHTFLQSLGPLDKNVCTFQPREWREGEFKSKAVLLPKREQFAFVLSILAKTDFHVSLLLAMLYYVKPCEWESHLISHSFLWLCSMQEFLLDQTPFILAAVAHPWIVSTKATYDVARRILCLTLSVVFW